MWSISVLLAWLSLFALGLIDNSRGTVFPDIVSEFHVPDTMGSLFFLLTSFISAAHNFVFRDFLARESPLKLIGIYSVLMAMGAVLVATASEFEVLLVASVVLGIAFGGLGVGQNVTIQNTIPSVRVRALGILHAMYGMASVSAPLLLMTIGSHRWRQAFFIVSLPALFIGIYALYRAFKGVDAIRYEGKKDTVVSAPKDLQKAAGYMALLVGCLVVVEISVSSRLTLLTRREWGVMPESASGWLAMFFLAMTVSRFFLGLVPIKTSTQRLLKGAVLANFILLFAAFFPFPKEVRLYILVAFGLSVALGYPLAMARIAEVFREYTQWVTGKCILYQACAAVLMHFILGVGADFFGLERVLGVIVLLAAAGAVVLLVKFEKN